MTDTLSQTDTTSRINRSGEELAMRATAGREVPRAVCRALGCRDAFDRASDRPVLDEVGI